MKDNAEHASGWFLKAESDLVTARRMLVGEGPYDTACFHAQQAVEKLLKGLLAFKNQALPHTHNLEDLQQLCMASAPDLKIGDMDLAELTPYAIEMRYDFSFWPDHDTASQAVADAERVREKVYAVLPADALPPQGR